MKKFFGIAMIALLGLSAPTLAQQKERKGNHKAVKKTKKTGKSFGHKTAELASKGRSRITDKRSDVWIGPQGQTIYLAKNRYYWINGKGKRIYVSTAALKARNR